MTEGVLEPAAISTVLAKAELLSKRRANRRTNEQVRAVQRRMREAERTLREVQGAALAALQDAVAGIRRTHDELATLVQGGSRP